jgi:predicted DNA-binding protein
VAEEDAKSGARQSRRGKGKRAPAESAVIIRLSHDIEKRLDTLAKKIGRTTSFYAREAIQR